MIFADSPLMARKKEYNQPVMRGDPPDQQFGPYRDPLFRNQNPWSPEGREWDHRQRGVDSFEQERYAYPNRNFKKGK